MKTSTIGSLFVGCILILVGCTRARELPAGAGQHPSGWVDVESADFHGKWLHANGDDLSSCRACHGDDYEGGPVGTSCTTKACHTKKGGPEFCGTCHGGAGGPMPSSGAHAKHAAFCNDCHDVPSTVRAPGHIDGVVDVRFSGLAVTGGADPVWKPSERTCSDVYCHAGRTLTWEKPPEVAPCDACHGAPPDSHVRWARVASPAPGACATCHPVPPDARHVNGAVDVRTDLACDTCHGHGLRGAPAPGLDGSIDPTSRQVGAHARHLDETLADRIGRVVACETCHTVPSSVTASGHLDASAPADVTLPQGGTYDAATQSCVVSCHFSKAPGPVWTDASGSARACDACHGFPPSQLRDGTVHTAAQPVLSACLACHPFSASTHVDGTVDLLP